VPLSAYDGGATLDGPWEIRVEVSKSLLGSIFDKLDMPIRFVYCHAPLVSRLLFWSLYTSNFQMLYEHIARARSELKAFGFSFEDKVCLELGPGNSFISAYTFLAHGARKVIQVDKFSRRLETDRQRDYFRRELAYFFEVEGLDKAPYAGPEGINPSLIELIEGDIIELDLKETADFVFSKSVLEHVKDPAGTVASLARLTKRGGIAYHTIDMRDHYNFGNPFKFYKYTRHVWETYLTREGISYTNRMRCDEFEQLFVENGFEIVWANKRYAPLPRMQLAAEFADMSEDALTTSIADFILRKR
jgi:SAM-dependent methyltransferase